MRRGPGVSFRPPPPPPGGELWADIRRQAMERTGHYYYQDKEDLLWQRLWRRLAATGAGSLEDYARRLADGQDGAAEWTALEAELTIGETFFFRYAEQFEALRATILPEILARKAQTRRLRIWSAGCANGAEPYSLSILLHDLLGPDLRGWRVSILGTDLNEGLLGVARDARYGAWALRALTPQQRSAWFQPAGGQWQLRPRYQSLVRFRRSNLLELVGRAAPLELSEFDLILCRNVLIYFHPEAVPEIAAALVKRLAPEGWLLVGHAEPNLGYSGFARTIVLPGTVAYRPPGAPAEPPATPQAPPPPTIQIPPPTPRPRPLTRAREGKPAEPSPTAATKLLQEIRQRADLGDLPGASLGCRQALEREPDNPLLHFYSGLLQQARGDLAGAEGAFRRAAYLDAGFIMAHYHLGLVRLERGRLPAGRRAIAAAARLAGGLAGAAPLPEGAGLTAADLREVARFQLDGPASGGST